MKKILLILISIFIDLQAYSTGDLGFDNEIVTSIDCREIIEDSIKESPLHWADTNCARTTEKIISLFLDKDIIQEIAKDELDFKEFEKSDFKQKLLSTNQENQRLIFLIKLCGGCHTFIIEKLNDRFRIFQSWKNSFTIAQWLDIADFNLDNCDKILKSEFNRFGYGQLVSAQKLLNFIKSLLQLCLPAFQERIAFYRSYGLCEPFEIKVTIYKIKE